VTNQTVPHEAVPVPIGVAPNGARRTHADHPELPLTAAELARVAESCAAAGASWLHVHVRDSSGAHSLDAGLYRAAFDAIRAAAGDLLLLQMTTEAVGRYKPSEQMAAVRAVQPEAVSIAVRELWSDPALDAAASDFVAELAARGVAIQFIAYSPGDIERLREIVAALGARAPTCPEVLLVLGSYATQRAARAAELLPLVRALPPQWRWSACAFGRAEAACLTIAAALGGGVRIGFENNLWLPDGHLAANNADLVVRLVQGLAAFGLRPATVQETRQRFLSS
jgi:uncharacterized protein (DUF849 family)